MKHSILSLAALTLMVAGCSNEENTPSSYVAEGTPITVNTVISERQTKAGYSETDTPTQFFLQIANSNKPKFSYYAQMIKANSAWKSFDSKDGTTDLPMYWAGDNNNVMVTAATFDFKDQTAGTIKTAVDLTIGADQSDDAKLKACDHLMQQATSTPPATEGIKVTLDHIMSKVIIEVDLGKDNTDTENPLKDTKVVGTNLTRTYTFSGQTAPAWSDATATNVEDITPYTDDNMFTKADATAGTSAVAKFEAIIVPQTVDKGYFGFEFKIADKLYKWSSDKAVELKSNYQYTLSLKMNADKLTLNDISVDEWGTTKDLGGGTVEETVAENIPVLTIDETNTFLTEDNIESARKGGTKLKIVGPLSTNTNALITEITTLINNKTVTELDLSELTGGSVNNFALNGSDSELGEAGITGLNTTVTKLTLPEDMTTILTKAFYKTKVTEFTIPASVTNSNGEIGSGSSCFGESVFAENTSLTEVTILGDIVPISNYSFENCSELTKVTFKGKQTLIGLYAFKGCNKLTDLYLTNCTSLPQITDTNIETDKLVFTNTNGTKVHLSKTVYDNLTNETYYSGWKTYVDKGCVIFTAD